MIIMENLAIYNQLKSVPEEAKKPIKGGRINGFTDINPMWRIKILTEIFGMVGFGWKYEIVKQWIEEGGNGEKAAFTQINLFVKHNGEWSEPIPGVGGSSFVANESKGPYTSDECYKMSLTDAISVACKALGVAADVYYAKDQSKYDTPPTLEKTEEPTDLEKQLLVLGYFDKNIEPLQKMLKYYNLGSVDDLSTANINEIYKSYKKRGLI